MRAALAVFWPVQVLSVPALLVPALQLAGPVVMVRRVLALAAAWVQVPAQALELAPVGLPALMESVRCRYADD